MTIISASQLQSHYDLVVIGSGFGSLFFVHGARKRRPDWRIAILEWGSLNDHDWQISNQKNSTITPESTFESDDDKVWNFTLGLGGGTNCWFGQTPRFHPNDFRTQSLYGVGVDWPVTYDELETYYCDAEEIMSIAGPDDLDPIFPRSRPYPQPPHKLTTPDEAMKAAQPDRHFALPTARARIATETRAACCASARCNLCPVDAKFTALNGFQHLFQDEKIDILLEAKVTQLDKIGDIIRSVIFTSPLGDKSVSGDLVVLGANAIHSPHLLLRSGIDHPMTGVGINEQLGLNVEVLLDGMGSFDGSTITTGFNLSAYDGTF